uniref:DUF834 domain-containing protein n=1 Tax=Oryza nivara TaxID=4536 RepID=A0A0E0IQK5_ORYNI
MGVEEASGGRGWAKAAVAGGCRVTEAGGGRAQGDGGRRKRARGGCRAAAGGALLPDLACDDNDGGEVGELRMRAGVRSL